MHSGKKAVNCTPCAKRKVRCDKSQPCGHCQRRKGDVCVYPVQRVRRPDSDPTNVSQRVEQLESYIRRLGGDPNLVGQPEAVSQTCLDPSCYANPPGRAKAPHPCPQRGADSDGHQSSLVEHNEQVTLIEAPMWYSWSGVKKPEDDPEHSPRAQPNGTKRKPKGVHYVPALFDSTDRPDNDSLHVFFPPATEMTTLWKQYLKNVHLLVMIFFDWEVEVLFQKACQASTALTAGEQALVLAVCFIATLSLTESECVDILHDKQPQLLDKFQEAVESALLIAKLTVASDRLVLQAFMLYLQAMRNRARPAAISSLMGIAGRIAERMGLHRDGDDLGIPVLRSGERRRMWWQLQDMEIHIAQLTGNIAMSIYADWNTTLPSNLKDYDLRPDMEALPPERRGLTTMSHCLWRYQILYLQRSTQHADGTRKDLWWLLSPHVPLAEKDAMIDRTENALGEKFLQHCEPLNPSHVHIQIGVRSFVLAARRVARQPALVNAKMSEMSPDERDEYLGLSMKCLEYYLLSEKTEGLKGFQWHSDNFLQWPSFVYVVLEAHHRFDNDKVANLWTLIGRVYLGHPKLMTAVHHPDVVSIVQMTLTAWRRRHTYILQQHQHTKEPSGSETPPWIAELRQRFNMPEEPPSLIPDTMSGEPAIDVGQSLSQDFDLDSIDWSVWEDPNLDASLYETDWPVT